MTADTDPLWTLALLLGLSALVVSCGALLACDLATRIKRRKWERDIEAAIRLTEADNEAARHWDELEFAASVRATIHDLPTKEQP